MESKGFSYNPFYPVSLDSIAVFFFILMPKRLRPKLLAVNIRENPCPYSRSPRRYTQSNSLFLRSRQSFVSPYCFMGSGGQLFTTLGPSSFNNSLTCLGTHTGTKTMGSFAFNITWLKCSFTHYVILLFVEECRK